MPFQVVFNVFNVPAGIISSFTAGEDFLAICDTSISLQATVIGDTTGHVFLWEQISGSAVTWTSPLNQLSATYTTSIFDDKIFRFWIDKGTPNQQFDDVIIYGTPTEIKFLSMGASNNGVVNYGSGVRCRDLNLRGVNNFPFTQHNGVVGCGSTDWNLIWDEPCDVEHIVHYIVQEKNILGPWNDVATVTPMAPRQYSSVNLGSSYRILTVFTDYFLTSYNASNSFYANPSNLSPDITAAEGKSVSITSKSENIAITVYNVLQLFNKLCSPDSPDISQVNSSESRVEQLKVTAYNVLELFKQTCEPDSPDIAHVNSSESRVEQLKVTAYNVLDLTGSEIGG